MRLEHWQPTVAVAARVLHNATVLVVAGHGLVAVSLAAFLDVPLDLHPQLALHAAALGQDAVRPVAHWLGVVFVARAILGLAQRIHLMVFTLVTLFALSCKQHVHFNMLT